jgi:uncharacterized protein YqjF (DUF2071 family)
LEHGANHTTLPSVPKLSAQELLREVGHRPYPLPERAWLGHQSWYDLLLAHWPVRAEDLRTMIPEPLEVDSHDGVAWVSIVPFRMQNVRVRGIPRACGLTFPELNLRTYVRHGQRSGVFFFSLDAGSLAVVNLGRRLFGLPYSRARISMKRANDEFRFDSDRLDGTAAFSATYDGRETIGAAPGSLDAWWMERYCFYSQHSDGRVLRCDIHHRPWPLQQAAATIARNGLGGNLRGIDLGGPPAMLRYSRGVDVVFWNARPV